VSQTRTSESVGTSGTVTTTTSTTYALVPGKRIELQEQVGHKVEVTGVLIPEGASKSKTKTKIEREHGKDTEIEQKAKSDSDRPQLRIVSIKQLNEKCNP
jgi:hypothetical protein